MRRLGRNRPALEALGRVANGKTNLGDARARGDYVKDEVIEADKPVPCARDRPRFCHYSTQRERPSTLTHDTSRRRPPAAMGRNARAVGIEKSQRPILGDG
jgi:hypothetical protein